MDVYIFLNPDGGQEFGMAVIVAKKTGVVYAHQCAGLYTEVREMEGFAVPLGDLSAAEPLVEFFRRFRGWPPATWSSYNKCWEEADLAELARIVGAIPFWRTSKSESGTQRAFLEFDSARMDELTEAWVPVRTVYGPGVLVFPNSD
ncbi:MAG: hypothetical protein HY332_23995 [Chloroflexi bacterium]|nr:hypothetical protein [Chloroflexota bacterium]